MAKSKSFFGLRRGSTKSHTYSVLNGQQITKDRVQTVANPKTQKQQFQRAIMATVMAAYSEMKAIEDHAFEGKKKGSENQREFMSRNLVAMRNAFLQYQEENPLPANQKFFAVGPKTPTVLPCEWILSHGTLSSQRVFTYNDSNHRIFINGVDTQDGPSGSKILNYGDAADKLGIYPGLQITFVCVTAANGARIFQVYPEDYAGYMDWEFSYCRYVAGSFDRTKNISTPTSDSEASYRLTLQFLEDIADPRTSNGLLASFEDAIIESATIEIDAEIALQDAGFDESLTGGIGVITSEVDTDKRSTSKMLVRNAGTLNQALGLAWEYVPDAWRNAGGILGQSDLYLEGGNV